MSDQIDVFLAEVKAEILRAQSKFPANSLATIALTEEVGELAKALLDESPERVRAEAVQVACMAFRAGIEGDKSVVAHRNKRGLGVVAPTAKPAEPVDPAGRPKSIHQATCAGCSWCSPAVAAALKPAEPCSTCGGQEEIQVGTGQPDGDGGEEWTIEPCPDCAGGR